MRLPKSTITAALTGAAATYFFDPEKGRSRRARFTDQAAAAVRRPVRQARREVEKKQTYAQDRAAGVAHELGSTPSPPQNDRELVDRVRSTVLGNDRFKPYTINVDAAEGTVVLRGQLDRPEDIRALKDAVAAVPGVERVENLTHLPNTPPPNLQRSG
jgi:osmotically-inducible protein OsmY